MRNSAAPLEPPPSGVRVRWKRAGTSVLNIHRFGDGSSMDRLIIDVSRWDFRVAQGVFGAGLWIAFMTYMIRGEHFGPGNFQFIGGAIGLVAVVSEAMLGYGFFWVQRIECSSKGVTLAGPFRREQLSARRILSSTSVVMKRPSRSNPETHDVVMTLGESEEHQVANNVTAERAGFLVSTLNGYLDEVQASG